MDENLRLPALVDRRHIEFGESALRTAIETVGLHVLALPAGARVRELHYDTGGTALILFLEQELGGRVISEPYIAALLISYLIAIRVPIGRTATKQVVVKAASVTLNFVTKMAMPPRP